MIFTVIQNGHVYAPHPIGPAGILVAGNRIVHVGGRPLDAIEKLTEEFEVIDAAGRFVVPGLIDSHEHLIGGSGEAGFSTQTPEVFASELFMAGITTVAGCLGVDCHTRNLPALLAKAKGLRREGITAHIYSGGYAVPPVTLTGSVRTDILYIEEVIGAGEVAISDVRSSQPRIAELARIASDAYIGGLLSGKAGITHVHVGDRPSRLQPLRDLLNGFDVLPECIYPTHVERNPELFDEAIALTRHGVTIDVDTMEEDLAKWLKVYREAGADPARLTASSDAAISSPSTLFKQVRNCIRELQLHIEEVLPIVTTNPARVLKLPQKGRIAVGADADLLILSRDLEIETVIASGKICVREGQLCVQEAWRSPSNRKIVLDDGA